MRGDLRQSRVRIRRKHAPPGGPQFGRWQRKCERTTGPRSQVTPNVSDDDDGCIKVHEFTHETDHRSVGTAHPAVNDHRLARERDLPTHHSRQCAWLLLIDLNHGEVKDEWLDVDGVEHIAPGLLDGRASGTAAQDRRELRDGRRLRKQAGVQQFVVVHHEGAQDGRFGRGITQEMCDDPLGDGDDSGDKRPRARTHVDKSKCHQGRIRTKSGTRLRIQWGNACHTQCSGDEGSSRVGVVVEHHVETLESRIK